MRNRRWLVAGGLLALVVVPVLAQQTDIPVPGFYLPGSVTPLPPNPPGLGSLNSSIARKTGLTEEQVAAVVRELGPAMTDRLALGQGFEIPGAGSFRLIRIVGHRELRGNVAVFVPARNTVEFVPSPLVTVRLNQADVVPGTPVGLPEFEADPNGLPGSRVPGSRVPSSKVPGYWERP